MIKQILTPIPLLFLLASANVQDAGGFDFSIFLMEDEKYASLHLQATAMSLRPEFSGTVNLADVVQVSYPSDNPVFC